ncbi:hypothetical protein ISREJYDI_CDS0126 [Pseudomonas phage UNO-G1W1]|uniref:Uncharacterized protein n=1 Tax=Pseudomonas phage UNO-G1W1 TaxID=3136609 RepID=A0AAX4QM44_9CAUD
MRYYAKGRFSLTVSGVPLHYPQQDANRAAIPTMGD